MLGCGVGLPNLKWFRCLLQSEGGRWLLGRALRARSARVWAASRPRKSTWPMWA